LFGLHPQLIQQGVMFSFVVLFATHTAQAFYNPSTGRWLSRDPIGENGGENLFAFICNDGIGDVDLLGLRQTRFTLKEMEAMLKKSKEEFQAKLVVKCKQCAGPWVDGEGNTQNCDLDTCLVQASALALAFELKLRETFTSQFKKHGNVIAFSHDEKIWSETINTRADNAPGKGTHASDFNQGYGLKCLGMQMLMRQEFFRIIGSFRARKMQCFKGAEVGNDKSNLDATHHWFGLYIGTNKDQTQIDVLVDPWYSAGGIISPASAGVSGSQAKYFDLMLW
jgi:hypothetical protein